MERDNTPFDGVIPANYPDTYRDFLNRACYKQRTDVGTIFTNSSWGKVFCNICYRPYLYHAGESIEVLVDWHFESLAILPLLFCDGCNKSLIDRQPIIKCGRCTEALLKKIEEKER